MSLANACWHLAAKRGLADRHMVMSDQTLVSINLAKQAIMSFHISLFFYSSRADPLPLHPITTPQKEIRSNWREGLRKKIKSNPIGLDQISQINGALERVSPEGLKEVNQFSCVQSLLKPTNNHHKTSAGI